MNEPEQALLPKTRVADAYLLGDRDGSSDRIRVIEPGRGSLKHLFRDLWHARELLYFLTWRDVKVRYKQTALGVLWAILQPVISMVVLSIVFGRLGGITKFTGSIPYPIFVYSGLLPWTFFAGSLSTSSNSVLSNGALVTKVRFPRIALPIASVAGELVDLGIAFVVLLCLMLWYHVPITGRLLLMPLLVLGVAGIGLGLGTMFAALTVSYRDFRYIIPFITQIWMFATPVIYPSTYVSEKWRWLLSLNPLNGWISGFRTIFFGSKLYPVEWTQLGMSAAATLIVLLVGIYYFRAVERRFAEVI